MKMKNRVREGVLNGAKVVWITLKRGEEAVIDADDLDRIKGCSWRAAQHGHVYTQKKSCGARRTMLLHRILLNPPDGVDVDHINRNPLDNRRENLRLVPRSANIRNSRLHKNNTSGFRGVCSVRGKWRAAAKLHGKNVSLGTYLTREQASDAVTSFLNSVEIKESLEYGFAPVGF